ncbi:hypothetical protein QAD02_015854 [Eretmocerus hayati]|uniref:Uncharacterized protein n=1 Tax=Eretmocerus hayati TaxID=131215 RepID=A0ACC2PC97_9HYME|nr:hypothetical protein QAD02_015854 [Eretmocerus hayati]
MSPQGSPSAGTTLIRISPPGPYRRVARTSIGRKSTEPRSGRVATDSKSPPIVAISPQGSPSARIRPRRGQASNILQEKHGTALETKVPIWRVTPTLQAIQCQRYSQWKRFLGKSMKMFDNSTLSPADIHLN